ncbi:hypothetical protein Hamer_G020545 [Homarus americanus]|uniref:Uncharacterized protein n=1 Tax=Homarus americanus TaxID=6706 RepID=A0A8J5JF10_HOMAM|nr:hypothetical protein Hamer_G020545 [Homarus americanus]
MINASEGGVRVREGSVESTDDERVPHSRISSLEVRVHPMAASVEPPGAIAVDTNGDEVFSQEAVMITECDGESYNTAATLHYCRRMILKPRDIIFAVLGYRSWNKDGAEQSLCLKVFNVVYFIFFLLCLCIGPVLQYNICLKRDQGVGNDVQIHFGNSSVYSKLFIIPL